MRISASKTIDNLLADPKVNKSSNDTVFFGWGGGKQTEQWRLGAGEAKKMVAKIKTYKLATQRALIRELHKRSGLPGGMGTPGVAIDTPAAASALNALAAHLGIDGMQFKVNKHRPLVPLAEVGPR